MGDAGPLVVLAAGLGRRFGGLKPLAPVGPAGEGIVEYALWDARRAGFDPLVLVVRSATRAEVERTLAEHGVRVADLVVVEQDADTTVAPRAHPWGTVHAIVACADVVPGGCGVVNGDDLYGAEPLDVLAAAVAADGGAGDHLVAHRWAQTVPHTGRANRGVCDIGPDGRLRAIREVRGLAADSDLPGGTPVSMNVWRFGGATLAALRDLLVTFAAEHPDDDEELTMPDAIGSLVQRGTASVRVHVTGAPWLGVTYPGDLEHVRAGIRARVAAGHYPAALAGAWTSQPS